MDGFQGKRIPAADKIKLRDFAYLVVKSRQGLLLLEDRGIERDISM